MAVVAALAAILAPACLAPTRAVAGDPPRAYDEGAVFGTLRTYVRIWEDVSPESRASAKLRVPFLQMVHVGSRRTTVEGLSVEALGYGEVEAIEPLTGNRGRGDLLLATVTWRGLPDRMLAIRAGRQLLSSHAANNVIVDGLWFDLSLPWSLHVEGWGGFVTGPDFDESADRWQAGARLAWNPHASGHLAVSFAHESDAVEPGYSEAAREVLGVDFSWRQIPWVQASGVALVDLLGRDLQELDILVEAHPHADWQMDARYRRYDPEARIPKTSIFSVFNDRFYDQVGLAAGWLPVGGLLNVHAAGSVLLYDDGSAGMQAQLRPRLLFDRHRGDLLGLEAGRTASEENGYWSIRLFGGWRPTDRLYLTADSEQAFYDEAPAGKTGAGHDWSHVSRIGAGVDVVAGLSVRADAAVLLSPSFEQEWLGMLRIDYDLSGRPRRGVTP